MAADTGMKLVLLAGGLTLANEWMQTNSINWRVPVATVLAAVAVNAVGSISPNGATSLGLLAVIVAAATPLNGKSPIQQINATVNGSHKPKRKVTAV